MEIEDLLLYGAVALAYFWTIHFPPSWLFIK